MIFCRTKYINSSADPINYRLSEYLMGGGGGGGGKSNGTNEMVDVESSSPEFNDPEARSPLTPNDCDKRFLHLPEGIDLALHRAKLWSKYAKDLINYIDKRSSLEADHVRNLTKLAQSVKPILKEEKYLPLQSVYLKGLDNDLNNGCATLANCSLLLGHKFIEPLAARRSEHEKIRKQIKSEWNRELKRTNEALANLRKARIIYFQRKQEYERLRTLSNLSPDLLSSNDYGGPIGSSGSNSDGGVGVGGCYGGNDPISKCERKKRIEEEACLRAQEAEIVYRNTINEANIRTRGCQELKRNLLIRIRELIFQCDQTLKAVTIGYFECQHKLYKPIVEQFTQLNELTKLYQPGSEYADYISQLPEFTETLRKCNQNVLLGGDYIKFDSQTDGMTSKEAKYVNCNNNRRSMTIHRTNLGDDPLKNSKDIELPITLSVESGLNCSTLPASLLSSSHHFRKLKTPSRCRHCDGYVCFQGLECINCGLTCHNKCRTELVIVACTNNNNNSNCRRSRGSIKKGMATFGVDLKSSADEIPTLLVKLINELDRRGSLIKGIYRVSGVKSKIEKLCQLFESCSVDSVDLSDVHPNVIANVLKLYLRQLPEPLITYKLYPEFIRIAKQYPSSSDGSAPDTDDPSIAEQLITQYKQLASSLPPVHHKTLAFLCHHLKRVADQSKINNMPSSNLGIVFGPTLLRSSESDSLSSLVDTGHQARAVQLLITYAERIFGPAPPSPQPLTDSSYQDDETDEGQLCENNDEKGMAHPNRTQVTLTLDGTNCSSSKGKDESNEKLINKHRKMINNNNLYNSNKFNDDDHVLLDRNSTLDGKGRGLERERLSPTPSIYSSSAVIKLSGQQIITGPSSLIPSNLPGNYDDSDERLSRSNTNNQVIGGSRNSLYEARRQFFASPSQSPLSSLTSPSSSSPLSSSSTSSCSIRPHSLITGSMSLNTHNLNKHNHSFSKHSSSPLSSTLSSPTTSASSPSNELPSMTMSSLSLTRPRKASIVSSPTNIGTTTETFVPTTRDQSMDCT